MPLAAWVGLQFKPKLKISNCFPQSAFLMYFDIHLPLPPKKQTVGLDAVQIWERVYLLLDFRKPVQWLKFKIPWVETVL